MNNQNTTPFNLGELPLTDLDYNPLIAQISRANRSITAFGTSLMQIPDHALLLSPLTIKEAVASSSIENIHTTLEEVLKHEIQPNKKPEAKRDDIREVINYRRAILEAVQSLDDLPLASQVICQMHQTLLSGVRGVNKSPGRFRTSPVTISQFESGRRQVIYTPPSAQDIPRLFSNLEKYIHYDEKDPLVQAAIIHAQFEMIHPFLDGNGRTGRILMPLFLYYKKVIQTPMFYLSEYLEKHKGQYYDYLQGISKRGDWVAWVQFFLTAVIEQADISNQKVQEIQSLYSNLEKIMPEIPAAKHYINILRFIFSNPVFSTKMMIENLKIPRSSCLKILAALSEKKVVLNVGRGRESIYTFKDLLQILHQ